VLFVKWLVEKGVDPKSVNFVEVTFPTMADIIKSGGVDAVLTAEPFVTRMTNADWLSRRALRRRARPHRSDHLLRRVARLGGEERCDREEIPRGHRGGRPNRQQRSREGLRLDRQVHQAAARARQGDAAEPVRADLKPENLSWWIDVMSSQKMLQSKLVTAKLVLN
jgi:NitT/TauT family transport system substrate-binding protein